MYTNIFDSHAHYDNERFDEDRAKVLSSLPDFGVAKIMNVAADMASCYTSIALANSYDYIYCAIGIHPHSATELNDTTLSEIAELAKNKKACAIGEIGLDYYYDYSPRDVQISAFKKQLELAKDIVLPVIVHSRDAAKETIDILKQYKPTGIVHCFSGSSETAKEVLSLGMYIGITGVVTFKNSRKIHEVILETPIDRMLIETDCPYMSPEPYRGKRSDSTMLLEVATKIAELKSMSVQEVLNQTYENACSIYNLN